MAVGYEKIIKGNLSNARIAQATMTEGTKKVASLGTAITFINTMNITPNPGAPAEISYTEVKNSYGVTIKAENNNLIVKASDGTAASSGTEATLQIQMMTSPSKRKDLIEGAKNGYIYAVMVPSGLMANGAGVAGWWHLLGKLTEVSFGDLNDETIQDTTVTFTAVLGYTAETTFDYEDYNTAMGAAIGQFGIDGTVTPAPIVAGDLTSILSGNLTEVGTVTD